MMIVRTYPRRGLHGAVVHEVGVRILRGDLAPGDLLPNEDELSGELAVSRTVLREAIKVLAAKRLVESRPKTGTRVRERRDWNLIDPDVLAWQLEAGPSPQFLENTVELRAIIEPAAARLAAERATDEQIAALEQAHRELEAAGDDFAAFTEPDLRFHALVLEASGNELLEHMAGVIVSLLRTLFAFASRPPGAVRRAAPLHGSVVEAIRNRDPDAAEASVRALLDDSARNLNRALAGDVLE